MKQPIAFEGGPLTSQSAGFRLQSRHLINLVLRVGRCHCRPAIQFTLQAEPVICPSTGKCATKHSGVRRRPPILDGTKVAAPPRFGD